MSEEFTPEDKYFMLYLLTNDHTSISGCYEIGIKVMAYELGYSTDSVKALLERMESVHGVISYSQETGELLILNWQKYNWARSPKLVSAVEKDAKNIKSKAFREFIERSIDALARGEEEIPYTYGMDRVSIPLSSSITSPSPITSSISNSIPISNNEPDSKKKKFLEATLHGICPQCGKNSMNHRPAEDGSFIWECYHGCDVSWINEVSHG